MPKYMVSYDLRASDKRSEDYAAIEEILRQSSLRRAVEVLASQWVVTSKITSAKRLAKKLRDEFSDSYRDGDRLLVCQIDTGHDKTWCGRNLIDDP